MSTLARQLLWPSPGVRHEAAHYRRAMKVRIGILAMLAALNIVGGSGIAATTSELDLEAYRYFLWFNLPAHAAAIGLNLWALRGTRGDLTYRWVQGISCVLELWTATTGLWVTGTIQSTVNTLWFVISIAAYRVYFDAQLGRVAFLTSMILPSVLVGMELSGAVTTGAIIGDPQHYSWQRLFGQHAWNLVGFGVAYALAIIVGRRSAELRDVRKRLARVMGGVARGRLQGVVLDEAYELGDLLGRGGMGEVYAARRLRDGAEVAVKVLHPFHSDDPEMLERFRREAAVAERVAAGHVPAISDIGTTEEGQHFIVMERLHGEDLEAHLARAGRLPVDEVVAMVTRIAAAVDALHEAGAVHRDLKPSNVFLLDNVEDPVDVRLLDFGISKFQDEAAQITRTVAVMGSPGFMSPEAARGSSKEIGPASDVFALGVIAYLGLTGNRPFPATDLSSFIYEVMHKEPTLVGAVVPELDAQIDQVLVIALAKEPELRYQSAGELARDLAAAVAGRLSPDSQARAARIQALFYGDTHVGEVTPGVRHVR